MSGLVLKLAPRERVLINGAVIQNGDRRSRLSIVTPGANILRLRDALSPEEVTTPARRVCFIAQQVLAGEADPSAADPQLLRGIGSLGAMFDDEASRSQLDIATQAIGEGHHYKALKALRALLPREDLMMQAHQPSADASAPPAPDPG